MGHPDTKGYYRLLNVAPRATAAHIKKAYRRRAKDLHPDTNQRLGAAEQFAALNEAYKVLSDPIARARYDTADLDRPAPGAPPTGGPAGCSRCGRVSAQPRYLIFHQVIGALTHVVHDRIQGVYCARCARDVGIAASLLTWALGWWGLPDGPWASAKAIWSNLRGGEYPPEANARLLAHQARAFAAQGRADLARSLAMRAVELAPDAPEAPSLRDLAGGDAPPPRLKDPWRSLRQAAPIHVAPLFLLVLLVVVTGVAPRLSSGPPPPAVRGAADWHVTEAGAALRAGPGRNAEVVGELARFQSVALRPVKTEAGWVPVWAGPLEGFLPSEAVAPGNGDEARLAWCRGGAGTRPESGAVLRRDASGPHALTVVNASGRDAVLKLRRPGGGTVLAVYVRAGGEASLSGLPDGPLQPVYQVGESWSTPCGAFLDAPVTLTAREPAAFAADLRLTLAGPGGADVPVGPEVFTAD
jgi:curved DNA-binding protein CbpA